MTTSKFESLLSCGIPDDLAGKLRDAHLAELSAARALCDELAAALEELDSHCYAGALELAESHPAITKARAALEHAKATK